ncbi:MAG: hypothetical protein COX77_00415 [Candidatus Komeilibacteria bacterium CG_4_10_14_0_2_um_filter_37_10]|uniref:Prepilin-type N-terminal cleavage/methylation domain-containing protein n=1 Tax=Candidatus Komeilibacteria bacterium CG_4_10_14_0_2_um_filter_37_10 TaxID=1974470 RepID=A0A2M7VGG9_9BACT|nr:MAG: hypothetical protein COX77_00415 [Candidatus Komeilibacteria bacterium CG_4_10_14_0_2_um_filter_37_10]
MKIQRPGFTLIEAIIYVAIISTILTVSLYFVWNIIGSQIKSGAIIETNQAARYIQQTIAYDFHRAKTLNQISTDQVIITLVDNAQISYVFDRDNKNMTRQVNQETPVVINTAVVAVDGQWSNLSTTQSSTIGLVLQIDYRTTVEQTEWQANISLNTSYDLLLAP